MEEAISQRSRCFLSLPATVTGVKELDCAIREASSRGMLLESTDKASTGPHWVGLPVTGFFRLVLRDHGLEETFYTFDSSIRGAATGPAGQVRLHLTEPDALVFGQRRKSLRVEPGHGRLRKAFLWRYDKNAAFALDAPTLRGCDFQTGLARVVDISAGGLRLALRAPLVRDRDLVLARGQRLVLHLQFDEPRVAGKNAFWMVARVRHVARDRISQDETVGLEFLASGCLDPKTCKIRWETVSDHVIPGLADIFYHWHLDRHREKLA